MIDEYLMYLRKSRKDSEMEMLGIDVLSRHEKTLLDHAEYMGIAIGAIYREVVSGDSISSRPQMQKLLREVESGKWKGVLVVEVERLARGDTIDQGVVSRAFQYSNTLIVTPTKTYDPTNEFDQEYFEFGLFMSRREYATIKRRMQSGRLRSVQDGYYVGSIAPYGYDRVKAPDGKHFTLAPNKEAATVRLIFELCVNKQYGYAKISSELKKLNIRPRNSEMFCQATVCEILSNPVYIGKLRWNRRKSEKSIINGEVSVSRPKHTSYDIFPGIHSPLVDEDIFKRANSRRSNWNAPRPHNKVLKNPLSGLLFCSECGKSMIRKGKSGKASYETLMCPTVGCKTVSCKYDIVEDAIIDKLTEMVTGYSGTDISNSDNDSTLADLLSEKHKEANELEKQRSNIYDFLEKGIYATDVFVERSRVNADKINELSKEIELLTLEIMKQDSVNQQLHDFIPQCTELLKRYPELTTEQKNKSLKLLIKKIVYCKTERNHWGGGAETSFSLEILPYIPLR